MRKIALILLIASALISCSIDISGSRTIVVSVALDYSAEDGFRQNHALDNPPNDQQAFVSQTEVLAEPGMMERYTFLSKDGRRTLNGREERWGKEDVLDAIEGIEAGNDDLVIFFYSGHGEDRTGNLVVSIEDDEFGTISPDELLTSLASIGGKKCVFLDSCYSGQYVEDAGILADGEIFGDDGSLVEDGFLSSLLPALRMTMASGKLGTDDIWVMSAATAGQLSYDSGMDGMPNQDKYGAFSYYLLSALGYDMEEDTPCRDQGSGGMTFMGLYQDVKDMMSRSMWKTQTPQITLTPVDLRLF